MKKAFKTAIFLILTLICVNGAQAQGRKVIYLPTYDWAPYHFGFLVGINFMNYNLDLKDGFQDEIIPKIQFPVPDPKNGLSEYSGDDLDSYQILSVEPRRLAQNPGFSVGVIGDVLLGRVFNFRFSPTLSLNWRQVYYDVVLYDADGQVLQNSIGTKKTGRQRVISRDDFATYIEFPMHIKYRSKRYNNIGAYLLAGVNPKLYLVSKQNKTSSGNDTPLFLVPKRADIALEIGAGYDIYNQWFKMGVELKMGFGLFDLAPTNSVAVDYLYARPIESMKTNQLQLSFTFE